MKKIIRILAFLVVSIPAIAQQGYPKYYEMMRLWDRADTLFKAGDYASAARLYREAANVTVEKSIALDYSELHYYVATSWALAKKTDNAFEALKLMATTLHYSNIRQLSEEPAFASLHNDKRWTEISALVTANAQSKQRQAEFVKQRTTYQGSEPEIIFGPHSPKMREFIDNDSFPFISFNYGHFRIYCRGDSHAARNFSGVKKEVDRAMARIFSVLQIPQYNRGLNLVLVDSAGELKELTGMYVHGGFSLQGQDLVFIVSNDERKIAMKHEVFHYISNDVWGLCDSRLLNEGGAVFTENECNDYENPVYSITAYLLKEKKLFPFQSLIGNFDNIALNNEVIAYFESAAIFKYLYEKYGVEKMKQLWTKGFGAFESIYGLSVEQLEKEWTAYMSTIPTPKNMDWETLSKKGC